MKVIVDLPGPENRFVRSMAEPFDEEDRPIENGLAKLIGCFPANDGWGREGWPGGPRP